MKGGGAETVKGFMGGTHGATLFAQLPRRGAGAALPFSSVELSLRWDVRVTRRLCAVEVAWPLHRRSRHQARAPQHLEW